MTEELLVANADRERANIAIKDLVDRLSAYALGTVELSAAQVRSIEILLKKSLPDLQSIATEKVTGQGIIANVVFKGLNE